jgi:hypothetical protein
MIAGRAVALRHAGAVDDLEIEMDLVTQRIELGDIKVLDVEESSQLFPDFAQKILFVEGGAERAADFVQYVKLFGAPGCLLDEIAVLNGHADLVAERE